MLVGLFVVLHSVLRACHRNHTTNFFFWFWFSFENKLTLFPYTSPFFHEEKNSTMKLPSKLKQLDPSLWIVLIRKFYISIHSFLLHNTTKKNLISQSHWSLSWLFSSSLNINFLSHISQNKKYIFFVTRFNSHAHIFCSILLPVMLNRIGKKIEKKIRN